MPGAVKETPHATMIWNGTDRQTIDKLVSRTRPCRLTGTPLGDRLLQLEHSSIVRQSAFRLIWCRYFHLAGCCVALPTVKED